MEHILRNASFSQKTEFAILPLAAGDMCIYLSIYQCVMEIFLLFSEF